MLYTKANNNRITAVYPYGTGSPVVLIPQDTTQEAAFLVDFPGAVLVDNINA